VTQETQPVLETPLAALHRAAGAKMGVWFGCELPDDFGDPQEEQRYINETVALFDKSFRTYFAFTGPDRVRYLNAILTNNIKELKVGEAVVSLLLNAQGRILAEIETLAEPDRLICISYRMIRERLIEVLDKYIIMDDVTLTDETDKYGSLPVEGPRAAEVVRELTGVELASLGESERVVVAVKASGAADSSLDANNPNGAGATASISCYMEKRYAGAEFVVEREKLAAVWEILLRSVRSHGGGPMGYQAFSAHRLVQGRPWFGYDFGEKQIPHEAGLENSHISYTKGCYTGQEIVERVRSRGQVNRRRVELVFSGDGLPASGAELFADGKVAGYVTRAARSYFPEQKLGMGYLSKEFRAAGTQLHWSGGDAVVKTR
jgi:folate-binding protein YgfZ